MKDHDKYDRIRKSNKMVFEKMTGYDYFVWVIRKLENPLPRKGLGLCFVLGNPYEISF